MASPGGRSLFPRRQLRGNLCGGRLKPRRWLSLKHFQHEAIEHELVGIDLLRAAAIETSEELLDLMLESTHLSQGRGQVFVELSDLSLLLFDEIMCLIK
jgi:hypothetical protein